MSNSFVTTGDGRRLAYRLEGAEGMPVILFINSIATTMQMWEENLPDFTNKYRVLLYDLRGHGASDAPAEPYSIDRLGYDVLEMLDELSIGKVHVVGLSLGGLVAQWLGIYAPSRVSKLVIANSFAYLAPREERDELIKKLHSSADMSEFATMFIRNWFSPEALEERGPRITAFENDILTMQPHGLAGALAAVRDTDFRRPITLIENPTLLIGGEHDKVTTLSLSRDIAATIPNARLVTMPTFHLSNVQFPRDFFSVVDDFLSHGSQTR
jgi:3-oxoadipate enol-lactonase